MADSILRQWKILQLIPRAPRSIKIAEIMTKLAEDHVDVPTYRTIQRDLDALASVFSLLSNEKRDGACYWCSGLIKTDTQIG